MQFPIKLKDSTVGYIKIYQEQTNDIIYAECNYTSDDILRLFAKTDNNITNLGVLEPSNSNSMYLKRKIKKNLLNNNTIYYLDDGSGKYIIKKNLYETAFNAGKEHKFAYLLTACSLKKVDNNWITYIKKARNEN